MKDILKPAEYAQTAVDEYKKLFGGDCTAIILYGSAAGGDFNPKTSDVNLLIILSSMEPQLIAKSAAVQAKLFKLRFAQPLFLDKYYIEHSADSYPMEFLEMKNCHQVLFGEDILAPVTIDPAHLRLQVERELKGKYLHLVHEFTNAKKSRKALHGLIELSLKSFAPVFRALLFIQGHPVPQNRKHLLSAIETALALQDRPLQNAADALVKGSVAELERSFHPYAASVKQLIDIIDHK